MSFHTIYNIYVEKSNIKGNRILYFLFNTSLMIIQSINISYNISFYIYQLIHYYKLYQ